MEECVRFEVFMAVIVKTTVFWDVMLCSIVDVSDECTASIFMARRISQASNQQEACGKQSTMTGLTL
jgi:hypothetical protein